MRAGASTPRLSPLDAELLMNDIFHAPPFTSHLQLQKDLYAAISFYLQDSEASLDINGKDSDPMPRYDETDENK
jgi:hypothetical protein